MNGFTKAQKAALIRVAVTSSCLKDVSCSVCRHKKEKRKCPFCEELSEFVPNDNAIRMCGDFLSEINRIGNFYNDKKKKQEP